MPESTTAGGESNVQKGHAAMMVLVSYDVHTTGLTGRRRLRHVAKACKNYGQRVQYSVFECIVDPAQWTAL